MTMISTQWKCVAPVEVEIVRVMTVEMRVVKRVVMRVAIKARKREKENQSQLASIVKLTVIANLKRWSAGRCATVA